MSHAQSVPSTGLAPLDEATACTALSAAAANPPDYQQGEGGRGVVIPGGGHKYFAGAWVCVRMLRTLGCTLPVELWHVGEQELNAEMRSIVEPLGVRCVDATAVARLHPVRFLSGWPIKSFALMHSGFREVLLLDADNMPLVDPTSLFDAHEYGRVGAIFWPDGETLGPEHPIWRLTGVTYRREPAVESAQLLVDRRRCWPAVALAAWMNNQHADFWYRHIYGDKDTFHFAWRALGADYAVPPRMSSLPATMIQHDFDGWPLFQHRHGNKWSLDTQMLRIPGARYEILCRKFLRQLAAVWGSRPRRPYGHEQAGAEQRTVAESLGAGAWSLCEGNRRRPLKFRLDGTVVGGSAREQSWSVTTHRFDAALAISGVDSVAWLLARGSDDLWMGQAPAEPGRPVSLRRVA
jgi:hypothetical protein